jgi:hypothetical protein
VPEPALTDDITAAGLDAEVRRDLRGLQRDTADTVARHLVAAGRLVDEDPELALEHARFARARASRIAVVREAAGIAAYHAGEWAEALGELRAARRMGGGPGHIAVMADIERALGRPERALELSRGPEARGLDLAERIELAIVAAGARRDLGELDAAVVSLQIPELDPARRDPWSARLFYAYADNLLAAGRESDALQWFVHAADADEDGETDAAQRIAELTGEPLPEDDFAFGVEDEPAADADDQAEAGLDPVAESSADDTPGVDGPEADADTDPTTPAAATTDADADADAEPSVTEAAGADRAGAVVDSEDAGADADPAGSVGTDSASAGVSGGEDEGEDARADGVVAAGADAEGVSAEGADAAGAGADRADIEGADIEGADVDRAHAEGADVVRADVDRPHAEGAHAEGADADRADAEGADADRVDVDRADTEGVSADDADAGSIQAGASRPGAAADPASGDEGPAHPEGDADGEPGRGASG